MDSNDYEKLPLDDLIIDMETRFESGEVHMIEDYIEILKQAG